MKAIEQSWQVIIHVHIFLSRDDIEDEDEAEIIGMEDPPSHNITNTESSVPVGVDCPLCEKIFIDQVQTLPFSWSPF